MRIMPTQKKALQGMITESQCLCLMGCYHLELSKRVSNSKKNQAWGRASKLQVILMDVTLSLSHCSPDATNA